MNDQLQKFHDWLSENCETYISMVANGSNVTGDTWIEGRSDYDILLVFSNDFRSEFSKVKDHLKRSSFTDDYFFIPFTKEVFLQYHNGTHDFSRKFRTRTLFGQDLISKIQLPTKEQARDVFLSNMWSFMDEFERRLLNAGFWSEKKVRGAFWEIFKNAFMHLQIKSYSETGIYPRTRDELARSLHSSELSETLDILKKIDDADKDSIVRVAEKLFRYLDFQRKT